MARSTPRTLDSTRRKHCGSDARKEAEFAVKGFPGQLVSKAMPGARQVGGDVCDVVNQEAETGLDRQARAVPDQRSQQRFVQNLGHQRTHRATAPSAIRQIVGGISKRELSNRPSLPRGMSGV